MLDLKARIRFDKRNGRLAHEEFERAEVAKARALGKRSRRRMQLGAYVG